jgi:hypothetical protein
MSGASAAVLCVVALVTAGAPVGASSASSASFAQPPAGYANRPNGAVLRTKAIDGKALGLPLPSWATEILFRTTDAMGHPLSAVTTVLVPRSAWHGRGSRPIVSYQTAEDSLGAECAPSNALQAGLSALSSNAEAETLDIAALLTRGWAVVTTDYEGPDSAFLTGPQEGYAVLDGIRAALAAHPHGLSQHAPIAMWGYSGGAFASAWALTLLPRHAPDLRIAGVAFGDMPSDLATSMRNVDGGYAFGLVFGGVVGIDRGDPSAHLTALLNARGRAAMAKSATDCTDVLISRYAFRHLSDYTVSKRPFDTPALRNALAANSLFALKTYMPIYDYHTTTDDIVPVQVANAFVARSCAAGDRIQVVRTPLNLHVTEQVVGAPGAMQFLSRIVNRAKVVNDC